MLPHSHRLLSHSLPLHSLIQYNIYWAGVSLLENDGHLERRGRPGGGVGPGSVCTSLGGIPSHSPGLEEHFGGSSNEGFRWPPNAVQGPGATPTHPHLLLTLLVDCDPSWAKTILCLGKTVPSPESTVLQRRPTLAGPLRGHLLPCPSLFLPSARILQGSSSCFWVQKPPRPPPPLALAPFCFPLLPPFSPPNSGSSTSHRIWLSLPYWSFTLSLYLPRGSRDGVSLLGRAWHCLHLLGFLFYRKFILASLRPATSSPNEPLQTQRKPQSRKDRWYVFPVHPRMLGRKD